jgi:hypothetical protein
MLKSQWQAQQVLNGQAAARIWLTGGVFGQPAGVYRVRISPLGPRPIAPRVWATQALARVAPPEPRPQGMHYRG